MSRDAALNRGAIARKAIEIADAEGFEAVSMRRIAAELGAGTMSLYHHVRNKDDLMALMDDSIMGEVLVPDGELPADWRGAVEAIARRSRAAFLRHSWAFDVLPDAQIGPSGLRHMEQSLLAVADTGLDFNRRLEIVSMVDDFTFGCVVSELRWPAEKVEDKGVFREVFELMDETISSGEFPELAKLLDGGSSDKLWERFVVLNQDRDGYFERGLKALLDGIELTLNAPPSRRPPRGRARERTRSRG